MTGTRENSGLGPIVPVVAPVREQLMVMLRTAILSGEWEAGDRLIERELCERTGASRTPVREALRQLEAEGLVASLPNRGPVVAVISADEAEDIYELRAFLEGFAARRFVQRATADDVVELEAAFEGIKSAAASGGQVAALLAKDTFYDVLLRGSGNTAVSSTLKSMQTRISMLRAATIGEPGRLPQTIQEIGEIVAAIVAGDVEAAERASQTHVHRAGEIAIRQLRAKQRG